MTRRRRDGGDRPLHRGPGRARRQRVVYVAVEGEGTEPSYLGHLNRQFGEANGFGIKLLTVPNGLKPLKAVERCIAEQERDPEGEFWAVFDRDQHVGIEAAFSEAARTGVEVAFSHPSFDLWLLLHFAQLSSAQGGSSRVVHQKLRTHPGFAGFGVRSKRLDARQVDALLERRETATRHARQLVDRCPSGRCAAAAGHHGHCDPHRRDPSSDVWRLLAALKIVGT